MGKEQDLLAASKNGDYSQVKKLVSKLKKSAKSDHSADDGKAKKSKSQSAAKKSAKSLNVNATDSDGFTALHYAALAEKSEICRDLLDVDADVAAQDKNGMSPLHLAAWAGRVDQSRLLLRSGADPNALSTNNETALLLAAQYGKTDVASVLLQHKADVGVVGGAGMTALDKACQFGHLEMVELLIQAGALRAFRPLSAEERRDPKRHTPLHLAAKHGHLDIMKVLVSSGMNVNLETANGTALHEAALYGRRDIVKFLVDNDIDVNLYNTFQQTALDIVQHFVRSSAAVEMKRILLESGCINVILANALVDYQSADSESLSFLKGDSIVVLDQDISGLWKGSIGDGENKRTGFFPMSAVSIVKRPVSTASIAAIVTRGGQTAAEANLPLSDSIYDCLQPKRRSDMPSPPPPVSKVKESKEPHQYGTLGQMAPPGAVPLVKDDAFSGKYTFDDVSPKPKPRRAVAPVQPYEEVDLKDVTARQKQEPVNYSQMQFLPSSGDVVHQKDPKVSYADVVLPRPEEPKSDESNRFSRSSSMSQVGSYENVEFQRRSASVSKPQAIPASRRPTGQAQRYENVVLPSEIGKLANPSVSFEYEGKDEVYEVMGARKSQGTISLSPGIDSSEEYMTMSVSPQKSQRPQQKQQQQLEPGSHSPSERRSSDASDNAYELMVLNADGPSSLTPKEDSSSRGGSSPCSPPRNQRRMSIIFSKSVQSIQDWCTTIRLPEYNHVLFEAGYEDTTFLVGLTDEILSEIGISKVGHRKKILAVIPDTMIHLPKLPREKPTSVKAWLDVLGFSALLDVFLSQGYDDIEFVSDMSRDDLTEIGVTKPGHIQKLLRGVEWLAEMEDQEPAEAGRDAHVSSATTRSKAIDVKPEASDAKPAPPKRRSRREKAAPPPKPKRPSTGVASPPFDSASSDVTLDINQEEPLPPPPPPPPHDDDIDGAKATGTAFPPAPPRRSDSFKKTRDRFDRLTGDNNPTAVPEEGPLPPPPPPPRPRTNASGSSLPPPPPPTRGDSLQKQQQAPLVVERTPTPPLPPPPEFMGEAESKPPTEPEPSKKKEKAPVEKPAPPRIAPKPSLKPKPPAVAPKPKPAKKPSPAPVVSAPAPAPVPTAAPAEATATTVVPDMDALPPPPPPSSLPPPDVVPDRFISGVVDDVALPPPLVAADLTLEDAIKNALRSPNLSRKEDAFGGHEEVAAATIDDDDDIKYAPAASSDTLMDDIDNMLQDLNRELDELIPGM
ncbi:caskin-2-like isoform X2 [Oscarella lobularis]|uniref:caskin-2-like isoform X2 n=1 Tax=Oscarella lobularis TaxID=121494 RepID=UPI0033131326